MTFDFDFYDRWTVSHTRSGFALFSDLPTLAAAQCAATELATLADWDQPGTTIREPDELLRRREILAAIAKKWGCNQGRGPAYEPGEHTERLSA